MAAMKDICDAYHELVTHNNKALDAQVGLRDKFEDHESSVDVLEYSYESIFSEIKGMADSYVKMGNFSEANGLYQKIGELEQKTRHTITRAQITKKECDSRPELMKRISDELYKNIETLSPHMEDSNHADFKISGCQTPHDLIRYFHQKGVDSLFTQGKNYLNQCTVSGVGDGLRKASLRGVNFNVIDLDDAIAKTGKSDFKRKDVQCIPLCAAIDFCCNKLPKGNVIGASNYPTFQAIASKDRMHMPWKLGVHYSELDALISEESGGNYIKLNYKDHMGGNSTNRIKYIKTILSEGGFSINASGLNLHAEYHHEDPKKTYDTLRESMRLLRSTLHLNTVLHSDIAVTNAVKAFKDGMTDIYGNIHKIR